MAKSAAVKIEVRWRETGTAQWSDIHSCGPAGQIVVEGLDRTKTYDFEWRGVSACGARSAWGSTAHAVPDVPAGTIVLSDLKDEVDNAAADALAANQELANIASDNVLSQGEKPVVIRDYNVITTEQAGIDAQATAYSITTQKTAYDNAVTALTSYLGTLTSPTAWNNLAGDTTIVGSTFRSKFADVYTSRQALLNAIYAAAKVLAGNAQSTASSAASAAAAAQAGAATAIAELDDIASDGKLTADEKVRAKRDYLAVIGEQAGIDGQATAFGITTEKAAYDSALTALKTYLRTTVAVLDASYNWTGITGTTSITRSTWDSNWTSVYTTRQALLNKIAAVAKALADDAQGSADAITASSGVINGSFAKDTSGWSFGGDGTFYREDGSNSANSALTTYLVHQGAAGGTTAYALNTARVPVSPGQVVSCIGAFKSVAANASAYAQMWIRWSDASGALIGTAAAPVTCGPGGTYLQCNSEAKGAAPAGAAYAQAYPVWKNHTSGYITCNSVRINTHLTDVDDLPDGATYGRPLKNRLSGGKPFIDFAEGIHSNKNIDYIGDGAVYGRIASPYLDAARPVINFADSFHSNKTADYIAESAARKWAAESGATVGADWSGNLRNRPLSQDNLITKSDVDDGLLGMWSRAGVSVGIGTTYFGQTRNWIRADNNAIALDSFAVTPGDVLYVSAAMFTSAGTGAGFKLRFADATGASLGYLGPGDGTVHGWQIVGDYVTVPANAVRATPTLFCTTGYIGYLDLKCLKALDSVPDGLTYGRIKGTELSSGIHRLGIAGSGAKVGNQFNNPNSLTLNYGAVRSTTALSATAAGAVSVSAFDYYAGAAAVHYNAVSNAVTGLSQGATYFIYCRDAVPSGGTRTWLATTNVNALLQTYDDIVVAGQVTIPTSGSSGGGGGGLCVCDEMLVADGLSAGCTAPGDLFDCMDLPRQGMTKFQRALQSVERSAVECVRLVTEHGAVWEGSASTPFDLIEGGVEWAPRMLGRQVVTDRGIEAVVLVEHIGVRPVSHIHLGGCSYAAGRDASHRVYSHNLQWKP